MKFTRIALWVFVLLGLWASPGFSYVETGNGTVLLYHLNEGDGSTAFDESSNNLHGTLANNGGGGDVNPTWTDPRLPIAGRFGNALDFGSNGFVRRVDSATLDLGGAAADFTIEAWIRPRTVAAGTRWIVSKWRNANAGQSYGLRQVAATVEICTGTGAGAGTCIATGNVLTANTLTHVVALFDNANNVRSVYINGVRQATGAFVGDITNSGTDLLIGGRRTTGNSTGLTEVFSGSIDEVRIRSTLPATAITAEELFNPGPVINTVTHTPAAGNETWTIYNGGGATIDLEGWVFEQCSGTANYIVPAAGTHNLAAGATVTISVGAGADAAATYFTANGDGGTDISALGASDCLRVYAQNTTRDATTIIDFVAWGADAAAGDDQAVTAGLWRASTYVSTVPNLNSQTISLFIPAVAANATIVGDNEEGVIDWVRHAHLGIFGEASSNANGDHYTATTARNTFHRYFIEVPAGTPKLQAEIWDADVGRATNAIEEAGNRDGQVTAPYNTTTVYRLVNPTGTTVATFTGSATAGMDNAFMTPAGFRIANPTQGRWRIDIDGTVGANGDDKSTYSIRVPGLYTYAPVVGYGKTANSTGAETDLFFANIHDGCTASLYDFDYDNTGAGSQGQVFLRKVYGTTAYSQTIPEANLTTTTVWGRNTLTGYATDFTQQDTYGIFEMEATINGVTPGGNYALLELRNYLGGLAADAGDAETDANIRKIYLPADNSGQPDVPYLIQFLYVVSGPASPTIGLTTRINVSVVVLDQSQKSTTAHTITARLPNLAQVVYVGSSASATQGSVVQPAGGATAGNIVWTIPTLTGTGAQLDYQIDVTPTAAGTLNLTGTPGGAVQGTADAFTSAHNTAEVLGPICQLQVTVGSSLATWVNLGGFTGTSYSNAVLLQWDTAAEISNLGFFVSYSDSPIGPYRRVSSLIAGLGSSLIGGQYYFSHYGKSRGYYMLEDLDLSGTLTRHGPIEVSENPSAGTLENSGFNPGSYTGGGTSNENNEHHVADSGEGGMQTYANVDIRNFSGNDGRGLRLIIEHPSVQMSDVVLGGGTTFKDVSMAGYSNQGGLECQPALPQKTLLIAVEGFALRAELADAQTQVSNLNHPVAPKPHYEIGGSGQLNSSFCHDAAAYSSSSLLPEETFRLSQPTLMNGRWYATLVFSPLRYRASLGELVDTTRLDLRLYYGDALDPGSQSNFTADEMNQATLAADASVLKIRTQSAGLHHVTRGELVTAGFDVNVDPRTLKLFYLGRELPIWVTGEQDGVFDAADELIFLAHANPNVHAEKFNTYWLKAGAGNGHRMAVVNSQPAGNPVVESFFWHSERAERNAFYASPYPRNNPSHDRWYGQYLLAPTTGYEDLLVNDLASVSEDAVVRVSLQGVTTYAAANPDHHAEILVGGTKVCDATWDGDTSYVAECFVPLTLLSNGSNRISVRLPGDLAGVAYDALYLDKIELIYPRRYVAVANALELKTLLRGDHEVTGLTQDHDLFFVDQTQVFEPSLLSNVRLDATLGGFKAVLRSPDRAFGASVALSSLSAMRSVHGMELNAASNWHDAGMRGDYVIVSPTQFLNVAQSLAQYRRGKGHEVQVLALDDVIDEFDFGRKSPDAIRNFIRYARGHWALAPQYVVLLGRGTYDPKEYLSGSAAENFIPVDFIEGQFMQMPSDLSMADINGDFLPDVMLGRLPAKNTTHLQNMIDRIIRYEAEDSETWKNHITTVNDDVDQAGDEIFSVTAGKVSDSLATRYEVNRISEALAGGIAQTKTEILASFETSNVVNWDGHGSLDRWGAENYFNKSDIATMSNQHLPLVVAMNCLNGNATYTGYDGIAEEIVRAPQGGAIAFLSLTGLAEPYPQQIFNLAFYNGPFLRPTGNNLSQTSGVTLGQAMLGGLTALAGQGVASQDVMRSAILLGDPGLRIQVNPPAQSFVAVPTSPQASVAGANPTGSVQQVESSGGCQQGGRRDASGWLVVGLCLVLRWMRKIRSVA